MDTTTHEQAAERIVSVTYRMFATPVIIELAIVTRDKGEQASFPPLALRVLAQNERVLAFGYISRAEYNELKANPAFVYVGALMHAGARP
jgi:hypothetical protein